MRHVFQVRIGPVGFRIGSDWRAPIAQLEALYAAYPKPVDGVPDFTVRLFAARSWRRVVRPAVMIGGDYVLPEAAPLPLAQGLLAAEMGMNLQMALGQRHFLLLHAAVVERDGQALILTGVSGAGKSTLAALLSLRGWRLMGDEFALLDPATGLLHAFPRLVSLKNASVATVAAEVPVDRLGPVLEGTPKGTIRHLVPDAAALAGMDVPARPALILFPSFGYESATRDVAQSEVFVRLTQASTNYVAMGERGFDALTGLVQGVPARAIDYPDTDGAIALVEAAWAAR
ncbi:HprK-related kinase A [Sphingomonas echinoides]|uniref:HprK-related kinase A n=1 Tax=Sphingomonas echinoides TaxID=59803 RepID=A0ABU4PLQ7_9SPHN|nr:HprK-related kinase A [Sphingomonas echinoides]MDX5984595.1 HprK-related kinase A [Sphingomonas echinoides]